MKPASAILFTAGELCGLALRLESMVANETPAVFLAGDLLDIAAQLRVGAARLEQLREAAERLGRVKP